MDEEEDGYVIDISNSYLPKVSGDKGGLCVIKSQDESLELLECFDEAQAEAFVYKFLRLVRVGNIYSEEELAHRAAKHKKRN